MSKPRLYLDSCVFIDLAKVSLEIGTEELDPSRRDDVWFARRLCDASRDGAVEIFTSTITVAECQHVEGVVTDPIKELFDAFLMSGRVVTLVSADLFVAEEARRLRWDYNLSLAGADAIHLASAKLVKCSEFVTTDGHLRKQKIQSAKTVLEDNFIKIIRASQTRLLPREYRQADMLRG
jgi:predicted nucleic acid-binding protein